MIFCARVTRGLPSLDAHSAGQPGRYFNPPLDRPTYPRQHTQPERSRILGFLGTILLGWEVWLIDLRHR